VISGSRTESAAAATSRHAGAGEPDHANERGTTFGLADLATSAACRRGDDRHGRQQFRYAAGSLYRRQLSKLKPVASNDDVNSCDDATDGFHNQPSQFQCEPAQVYHIAVMVGTPR